MPQHDQRLIGALQSLQSLPKPTDPVDKAIYHLASAAVAYIAITDDDLKRLVVSDMISIIANAREALGRRRSGVL